MTLRTKRSLRRALLSFAAAFALLTQPGWAATINVPSTATPTIQSGIDAASDGDTVLVAPGTYFENINFKGKAITVTSSGGPTVTTIDGGNKMGVATVSFATGEARASVISGLTIRGGGDALLSGGSGVGGVYIRQASPTIQGNTITANFCYNIAVDLGTATIKNNEISGLLQSPPEESHCFQGGGIFLGGTPDFLTGLGSIVDGNTIENNLTGSGISMWAAQNVLIMNNIIRNNVSPAPGSAFTSYNSTRTAFVQNLIYSNTSTCGAALAFEDGDSSTVSHSILIANNTIVDNITPRATGGSECTPIAQIYPGIGFFSGPDAVIVNNVVSGSTSYPAVNCVDFVAPAEENQPIFEYNILYNAGGPFFGSHCIDVTGKQNNVVADPQFVDSSKHDYHLKKTSPAIDSGLSNVAQTFRNLTGISFLSDLDGSLRPQDAIGQGCTIDMGAYEYSGSTSDCSSVTETLQSSLNPSSFGQTVTFTAQLSSATDTIAGDVQFSDGSTVLGTVGLSDTGSAAFSSALLTIGSHNIKAIYQPSGSLTGATAVLTQVVTGYTTSAVLTSSLNPASPGQALTFATTVNSTSGTPTGNVTFSDGTAALGTQALLNGVATYTTTTLAPGTHHILATYTPDSTSFLTSTATLTQVVNGTLYASNILFTSDPNPSPVLSRASFTIQSASDDASYIPSPIVLTDTTTNIVLRSLIPDSSGNAIYSTTILSPGVHHITATYAGDGIHAPEQLYIDQDVVGNTEFATKTTLTSSLNPANVGQSVTFSANVTSPNGVPIGYVGFVDEGQGTLATPILVNGVATFTTNVLTAGTHLIFASYHIDPADEPFMESDATLSQVINGITTATKLTVIPTTAPFGTIISMYALISASGATVTSGTVSYMDGTTPLTTITLAPNLIPNFNISTLAAGTHIITAVYSGDATHNASTSAPVTVTITAASAALSLTSSRNPAFALQPFTLTAGLSNSVTAAVPVGVITFFSNGEPIGAAIADPQGNATLTLSRPTGVYTLTASFSGSGNFGAATSAPVTETVLGNPTATVLSAAPNPGFQGGNETLTATVATQFTSGTSAAPPVPTGTVTFFDDGAPIATSAVDATGHATFSTTTFTVGNHALTATLNSSANFLTSTSQPYALAILLRDFTLTADPTITIPTEHHKDLNLTLASVGDFSDVVALSCGPMPADAYCTFPSRGPLLAAGSTLPSTVRIDTDAIYNYLSSAGPTDRTPTYSRVRSGIVLALLLPITLFAATRRRALRHRIKLFASLSIFLMAMTFTGCSGHYPGHTPPGSYSFTVTGKGATTHITHTATVTLIVTQ